MHETAANLLLGLHRVRGAWSARFSGALSARRTAELLGRKRPMILAAVLFLVSAFGSAFPEIGLAPIGGMGPDAIWPFIFYRVIGGVAVGLASVIAPMYVAEFAPQRGARPARRLPADRDRRRHRHRAVRELGHRAAG